MNGLRNTWLILFLLFLILTAFNSAKKEFVLSSDNQNATIVLLPGEPKPVQLAVDDLISDVKKITGTSLTIVNSVDNCKENCVVVGTVNKSASKEVLHHYFPDVVQHIEGKWEAYQVKNKLIKKGNIRNLLVFAGSDYRGTMFAIYDFIENYLHVDPMYFWSDRKPEKRDRLAWKNVNIKQDEPSFKYRGIFINDEDLLTHWKKSEGRRYLGYYYYHQVTSAKVMEKVCETALRLRYNLIIPASFIDIKNPPEKKLVDVAVKRGMFVSMHHIEPLGVGGYTYFNYWEARGKNHPKFSYYSNPQKLKQIWKDYAETWSQYGDKVIWQLGLRGIGDRPMWAADPGVPQSDADRGEIISEAMEVQKEIVEKVDNREQPVMTTTLWAEGSHLHDKGYLKFPKSVSVIYSDNNPGWKWQKDFYNVKKDPSRNYGIYYHQQLWGSGPHLVQGVSPWKTYALYKEAVKNNSHWYAINNVSNIRPFILGITATGKMMYNFAKFDPDLFFKRWCQNHFGKGAEQAAQAYQQLFNSYVIDTPGTIREGDRAGTPMLLDGLTLHKTRSLLNRLKKELDSQKFNGNKKSELDYYLRKVRKQKSALEIVGRIAKQAEEKMNRDDKRFFRQNLVAQQKIMHGLTAWLENVILAYYAIGKGDIEKAANKLLNAGDDIKEIRRGEIISSPGKKWRWWYWGDRKMDLDAARELWKSVLIKAQQNIKISNVNR